MDRMGTAFPVALEEDFSDAGLEKLSRRREEVRDHDGADSSPQDGYSSTVGEDTGRRNPGA